GMVCGLTRGAKREHFVRACLESIAYQVFDVVHAMEADLGEQIKCLKVDGGGSVSDVLMQFQADILNSLVHRPTMIEATALGVCFLAGIKCGMWKSVDEIERNCVEEKTFCPTMPQDKAAELIMGWEKAVARSKFV
ncbi:MAG: FGGY-family carbohydrate kinase, partial [Clostridia bacterium]